jgi:hypothetical protein
MDQPFPVLSLGALIMKDAATVMTALMRSWV